MDVDTPADDVEEFTHGAEQALHVAGTDQESGPQDCVLHVCRYAEMVMPLQNSEETIDPLLSTQITFRLRLPGKWKEANPQSQNLLNCEAAVSVSIDTTATAATITTVVRHHGSDTGDEGRDMRSALFKQDEAKQSKPTKQHNAK
jgi:hypothetical protein